MNTTKASCEGSNPPVASDGLTDDAFLGGSLNILQPKRGYRAGLDAVLLAAALPVTPGKALSVLDAGSGVGAVGLCVARRVPSTTLTLIEREPLLAELARRNADRNGLKDRVQVIEADLSLGGGIAQGAGGHPDLRPAMFDCLLANPPYRVSGTGTRAPGLKGAAHQLDDGDLDRWVAALTTLARSDASLTIIHEAVALGSVLRALDGRFGRLRILPIHPRAGEPANRIIVQGRKASRAPLALLSGLVLHGDGNAFTPQVDAILRQGAVLNIGSD